MTQQWLHRKRICGLSWFPSNLGGGSTCESEAEKNCLWRIQFKLRSKRNTERLNSLSGAKSSNLYLFSSLQAHSCGPFSTARACWVQQIGVNWFKFILEEPQGSIVISKEREIERRQKISNTIILKCCQISTWHCPLHLQRWYVKFKSSVCDICHLTSI